MRRWQRPRQNYPARGCGRRARGSERARGSDHDGGDRGPWRRYSAQKFEYYYSGAEAFAIVPAKRSASRDDDFLLLHTPPELVRLRQAMREAAGVGAVAAPVGQFLEAH